MQLYNFQCLNPDCKETNGTPFVFESIKPECPKCGNLPPLIGSAAVSHYGYYAIGGKIKGFQGRRLKIACDTNLWCDTHNCVTSHLPMVTCKKCKETQIYKDNWFPTDMEDPLSYLANPNLT